MTHTEPAAEGVVSRISAYPVAETVGRFLAVLADKGLTVFTVFDHSGAARSAGLDLPDTKVIVFGSPAAGTPVMLAAPLAALDLPLKVLVWADADGVTRVSYTDPDYLATRHGLAPESGKPLHAVAVLTELALAG